MNCGNEIVVWFYFKTLSKLDIETWYLIITAPNDIMSLVIKKKCTVRMRTNQFCVVVVALQKLTMLRHRCINVDANGDRITSFLTVGKVWSFWICSIISAYSVLLRQLFAAGEKIPQYNNCSSPPSDNGFVVALSNTHTHNMPPTTNYAKRKLLNQIRLIQCKVYNNNGIEIASA